MKKGIVIQEPGKPLQFSNVEEVSAEDTVSNPLGVRVAETIKAYRAEARNLLKTQYAGLKNVAPLHLREPRATALFCVVPMVCVSATTALRMRRLSHELQACPRLLLR